MAEDLGEKTEEPTERRRQEARRSGNIARSQELGSAVMLAAGTTLVAVVLLPSLGRFKAVIAAALDGDMLGNPVLAADATHLIEYVAVAAARIGLPLLLVIAAAAFLVQFLQVGWLFAPKLVMPKLNHLSPIAGFRRLFSITGLFRTGMAILKTVVVAAVSIATVYQYRDDIVGLAMLDLMPCLLRAGLIMLDLAIRLLAVLLLVGLIDLLYQKWKHNEDLKMTKHEVKDEMRQMEGDPQTKKRRFRMQQDIAMQRLSAAVPKADVVVTNPEHISVAIRYDAERMNAPKVIAKGADFVAMRIRQIALINAVPVVERPPLARALYRQVAVGQEIPPDFYRAVAEILAHVYGLGGRPVGVTE